MSAALSPTLADLFYRQGRSDQRHALAVYSALQAAGRVEPALLQAALLHDVGKVGGGVPILYRVAIVLIRAGQPAWLPRLADPRPHSWRHPFHVYNQHPARGAALAQAAGATPAVVALIAAHHAPGDDLLAIALYRADEAN